MCKTHVHHICPISKIEETCNVFNALATLALFVTNFVLLIVILGIVVSITIIQISHIIVIMIVITDSIKSYSVCIMKIFITHLSIVCHIHIVAIGISIVIDVSNALFAKESNWPTIVMPFV